MIELTAGGGVLFRKAENGPQVLLIKRHDVWDLPKGKKEEGETVKTCARREVAEEVGIPLPEIKGFLIRTHHTYERQSRQFGKTTYWYKMQEIGDNDGFVPQQEEGITEVAWIHIDEALKRVGFKNLEKVLRAFKTSFP